MEKVIQECDQILNEWLQINDFKCKVEYSDKFGFDYQNSIIFYTFEKENLYGELFLEICKSIYPDIEQYNIFIILFFYQLGHFATKSYINNDDKKFNLQFHSLISPTDEDKLAFFVSFAEWEAINWACYYIQESQDEIADFQIRIQKIIGKD